MSAGPPERADAADRVILRADGASRGNPGPSAAGIVIEDADGNVLESFGRRLGNMTNNAAEYRALILGLEACRNLGAGRVDVRLDSELVVKQLLGEYRVKEPSLLHLHAEAQGALGRFAGWTVRHVPREQNAAADRLANQALEAVGDGTEGATGGVEEMVNDVAAAARDLMAALEAMGGVTQALGMGRDRVAERLERLRERVDAALRALGRG